MRGKIIKGIAGFYYVHTGGGSVYECKAKGIFRKDKIKPLPGDDVEISVLSEEEKEGNIERLLERRNSLIRPAAANVDGALIIFALKDPEPNLNLLDRFLVYMEQQDIPVTIFFNKSDLDDANRCKRLSEIYRRAGYKVITGSVAEAENEKSGVYSELMEVLKGKTTVLAGPSGVGKSSFRPFRRQLHFGHPRIYLPRRDGERRLEAQGLFSRVLRIFKGVQILGLPPRGRGREPLRGKARCKRRRHLRGALRKLPADI